MDLMATLKACTARIETLEELQKELQQKEPVPVIGSQRQTPLALKKGRKPLPHLTIPVEDAHYMQPTGLATPCAPRKETKLMYGDAIVDLSVLAAKPSVRHATSLTASDLSQPSSD